MQFLYIYIFKYSADGGLSRAIEPHSDARVQRTHTHICTLRQQINWTGQRRSHLQLNLYGYVKQSKQQIRRHDEVEQSDNEYVT